MAEPHSYPIQRNTVAVEDVGPGHALVDRETEAVHVMNDTALALWELCDGETSPSEMVDAICELFDADREHVVDDVFRTLAEFRRIGVVE